MIRTISLGSHSSVQGRVERTLPDGRVVIRLDDRLYAGLPLS